MRSMTGYGSGECETNGIKILIQISSFNRKQADIRFTVPKEIASYEKELRKRVNAKISRGAVNVKIDIKLDPQMNGLLTVDRNLATKIFEELMQLSDQLNLDQRVGIQDLLSLQNFDIIKRREMEIDDILQATDSAMEIALGELIEMKVEEGESIKNDLESRHKILEKFLGEITKIAPEVPKRYQNKLAIRVRENIDKLDVDDDRILKEVVLFADRCDIAEEITRISTHLDYMAKLFNESKPIGRKLDFLIQEIFREINTIGSKCNDIDIATFVIDFKTELERIREQIQNIE